jgi:hypothetical protein
MLNVGKTMVLVPATATMVMKAIHLISNEGVTENAKIIMIVPTARLASDSSVLIHVLEPVDHMLIVK